APSFYDYQGFRAVSCRSVVRNRLAGDDGGGSPERQRGGLTSAGAPVRHRHRGPAGAGRGEDVMVVSSPARTGSALAIASESLTRARSLVAPALDAAVL